MDPSISSLAGLDASHKQLLSKAGIYKVSDIWLHAPTDLSKKTKAPIEQVQAAIDATCKAIAPKIQQLSDYVYHGPAYFTTGDPMLNEVLGGGIRTSMITEICGESSSGKTQLALQLALVAQLTQAKGGLDCGVAYFTTTGHLPIKRLAELARSHPLLRTCDQKSFTDNIHSCSTTTLPALMSALRNALPQLCRQVENPSSNLKPIRLLIIDSLGSLFLSSEKTTTATLVERSKLLGEIGQILHRFASSQEAAIIVLNQVTDIFQNPTDSSHAADQPSVDAEPELVYKEQAIWFNRVPFSDSFPAREAILGLVWANQINTRIMLSRTRRRIRSADASIGTSVVNKRRKGLDGGGIPTGLPFETSEDEEATEIATLIRKISIIFSGVCAPQTLEFVVIKEGIQGVDRKPMMHALPQFSKPEHIQQPKSSAPAPAPADAKPTVSPSPSFISARLTQTIVTPSEEDAINEAKTDATDQPPPQVSVINEEDEFDQFDEEEWASYGVALGELEEQWDIPEPENQPSGPADQNDDNEILESSDVEENLLLESMITLSQRALVLDPDK